MNEKYIQALILGSLIGGAILFDDYVKPKKEKDIKKMIKLDYNTSDISDSHEIKELDMLQNMNVLEGLDLENLKSLEDVDVEIKIEVKNKEED